MTDVYVLDTTFLRGFMKTLTGLQALGDNGVKMAEELTVRLKGR